MNLKEAYEDRVADTAERVIHKLNGVGTMSDIKKAIHDIASPSEDARIHNNWLAKGPEQWVKNGVPDYNGSKQARNEFIADVIHAVKHHLTAPVKRPPTGAAARHTNPRVSAWDIWEKFQRVFGDSFPDGDPMDSMWPWMQRNGVTMEQLDSAVRKYSSSKSSSDYLADAWDEHAKGALHDAADGHYGDSYDGQWFTRSNPWK